MDANQNNSVNDFKAMTKANHQNKNLIKSKTLFCKSAIVITILVVANLCLSNTSLGQVTKTWIPTNGGNWLISGNWSPAGVPASTDHVFIPVDQSGIITRASSDGETISLKGLTINGNVNFQFDPGSANACTINITETFTVAAGKTFTVGINNAGRLNFTLASTATGTVYGTVFMNSYTGTGYDRTFTNSGQLSIPLTGLVTGQNSSDFILSPGATLLIESTTGITSSGAAGAIQIPGTRTYAATANYIYNGSAPQASGNGLPATVSNLTISNNAGVTLPSAKTVTNNLSITSGAFINLGTFTHTAGTLTLSGSGTASGSWGSTSSLATNKNNTYFAATTGIVNVTTGTCTSPAPPTVTTPVKYCQNATVTALTASGTSLLWYTTATGGSGSATAPTPGTTTVGTTPYYVSQTVGCESQRSEIDVVINASPVSSVTGQTNITCNAAGDGTITISATGGTGTYLFSVDDGTTYKPDDLTPVNSPYIYGGLIANHAYRIKVKDGNGCISK
jgi:hypothetical protein